ncbi:MAG TPA: hypothetical protein VJI15_04685 [Candidatus Nanoarchaeia archaeon]|nr:hypothetical protein [Candidatus Nanoarchaeia archaeon]
MTNPILDDMLSSENVARATYLTAFYDHMMSLPGRDTLRAIKGLGLERFLPTFVDFESGRVTSPEALDSAVRFACRDEYFSPEAFVEHCQREQQGNPPTSEDPVKDLNYRLVGEVLHLSPAGEVNPTVYKIACGRILKRVGIDAVREMYAKSSQRFADDSVRIYSTLIMGQVFAEYQRFINELPILEHVLRQEVGQLPEDISKMDVAIFTMYRPNGRLLRP